MRETLHALASSGQDESPHVVRVLRPLLDGNGDTAALLEQVYAAPAGSSRGVFLRTTTGADGRRGIRLSQSAVNDALVILYGATRSPRLLVRMRERARPSTRPWGGRSPSSTPTCWADPARVVAAR